MRVVITGGGTGGHIYPALAVARGIKDRHRQAELLYIGTESGLESDLVPKACISFSAITAVGLKRKMSLHNLTVPWKVTGGMLRAAKLLRDFSPRVVVGTGGYVCGPVVLAATLLKIPTLIHEQNAFPGITNRILSRFADCVAVTFSESFKYFPKRAKLKLTGLPVRTEILAVDREKARASLKLSPEIKFLLSFGGSQGARSINQAVPVLMSNFSNDPGVHILHITGPRGYDEFSEANKSICMDNHGNITAVPYLYNMPEALAAADLVICRAGAATLAELTARGLPGILIPYPYASENHQEHNARALVKRDAAEMILDRELSGEALYEKVKELLANPSRLNKMSEASKKQGHPTALEEILDCIEEII
jgi:UDP-N-acetylglucosamine--N-acetylmuramyl-(pentapeptide) pyrophosphoryl-undecaprenol N-acetylglucosamine transferase